MATGTPSDPGEHFLYPNIEPYSRGSLELSSNNSKGHGVHHKMYYEESGTKDGLPIVFLHGGPGACSTPRDRRFFNPQRYRIILYDQRGCGNSTPLFSIEENNTWALVDDLEVLRTHLGIEKWLVFGGSWGSTLGLAYAQKYVQRVLGLILHGIFTFRAREIHWQFREGGVSNIFPDEWDKFIELIPMDQRDNLLEGYSDRLETPLGLSLAKAWTRWGKAISRVNVSAEAIQKAVDETINPDVFRIEVHYMLNSGFLKKDTQLLDDTKILLKAKIPVVIVQGRLDMMCPMSAAWELHKRLPGTSELFIIDNAGHSSKEAGITAKLVEVCDSDKFIQTFEK